MPQTWTPDSLTRWWTLLPTDLAGVGKRRGPARLGFALLLKYFAYTAHFPRTHTEIPPEAVTFVAQQLGVPATDWHAYSLRGHPVTHHRAQIRARTGVRPFRPADRAALVATLREQMALAPATLDAPDALLWHLADRCVARRIEVPPLTQMQQIVHTAVRQYDDQIAATVAARLPAASQLQLESLIHGETALTVCPMTLRRLWAGPRHQWLSWDEVVQETMRLQWIQELCLPADLFPPPATPTVQRYAQQARQHGAGRLRLLTRTKRLMLLAAIVQSCEQDLTDRLVERLIEVGALLEAGIRQHRRRSARTLMEPGVASTTDQTLPPSSTRTQDQLQTMIAAYRGPIRLLAGTVLDILTFADTTGRQEALLAAHAWVRQYRTIRWPPAPPATIFGCGDIVPARWHAVLWPDEATSDPAMTRLVVEICVLRRLCSLLKHHQLGVVGAVRYHIQGVQEVSTYALE